MTRKDSSHAAQKLAKRRRSERRFRMIGRFAIALAGGILALLLISIALPGIKGVLHSYAMLEVPPSAIGTSMDADRLVMQSLKHRFPEVKKRGEKRALRSMLAPHAHRYVPKEQKLQQHMRLILPLSASAHLWRMQGMPEERAADYGLSAMQASWLRTLEAQDDIRTSVDWHFFTTGDSREPEKAGFGGSVVGSFFVIMVCLALSLPIGVAAAIYLEEYARPSLLRDLIEVNVNNLAAIPSIIYGLLGLFIYLGLFGMPRSSALVGGLTLSLMTLPVIIIATRIALAAVPDSLRDAARGMGASPLQVIMHHVLPQALPGIMTGTILGMARAVGETAPLLMIGMVAFIANIPANVNDPATAMPVQIYLWASSPEQGFMEKTASGILVLIVLLLLLNLCANAIRSRASRGR